MDNRRLASVLLLKRRRGLGRMVELTPQETCVAVIRRDLECEVREVGKGVGKKLVQGYKKNQRSGRIAISSY